MPYDVPEGTNHTAFLGRHAGKAGKDAHPARAGAAILPQAPYPAETLRQIKRLWEPRGATCRQKMHMARFARARQTSSVQEFFSIPL